MTAAVADKNAAIEANRIAMMEQLKIQSWLKGQAIFKAHIEALKTQGASKDEIEKLMDQGATQGFGAAIASAETLGQHLAAQAAAQQQALQNFLSTERDTSAAEAWLAAQVPPSPPGPMCAPDNIQKPKTWWEKTIDWVDNHQPGTSIGVGAIVGLAAIAVTLAVVGAVTLPVLLVAAAVAALAAGATVAAGTLALNAHYDRPPTTNIWSNVKAAAVTAATISGVGLFVAGGLLTQATIAAGNAIAGTCAANPSLCANAGTVLNVVDTLEESSLVLKLAVETATGNPQAGQTAIELQLEQMDGSVPGNTFAREMGELVSKYGDDAVDLVNKYGDDIVPLLTSLGDDANDVVDLLKKGSPAPEDWTKYIPEDFQAKVASGFDGDPIAITLDENVSIYRYWSDISAERGRWTTLDPNLSPEEARAVLSLPNENYAYGVTQFVIPPNTTVLVGRVSEQTSAEWSGAFAIGGGFQIFVPDDSVLISVPLLEP